MNDLVMIEVKASRVSCDADDRQSMNYLKSTKIEVGYILYFGPTPQFRRMVFTNDRKQTFTTA